MLIEQIQTRFRGEYRRLTAAVLLVVGSLAVILIGAVLAAGISGQRTGEGQTAAAANSGREAPAYIGASGLSPAQAAVHEKPAILYFYPVEACQIHYCLTPSMLAEGLGASYEEAIDLVVVPVYRGTREAGQQAVMANWDLYLVPPYDGWIPEQVNGSAGDSARLQSPVAVLISGDNEVLAEVDEAHVLERASLLLE